MTGNLLDDFFDYFDDRVDVPTCDIEHPRLAGNLCILDYEHTQPHQDAAGNEWVGKPSYD